MKLSFGKPVNKEVGELLAVPASATTEASLSWLAFFMYAVLSHAPYGRSYLASLYRHRFQRLYADSQYDLLKLRESSSVHLCEQELRPQADGQPSILASLTGLTYIKQTDLGQQNA